eukprot:SM000125S26059  [mRNA]  locus=s125:126426:133195:+ [translate_table: standard]
MTPDTILDAVVLQLNPTRTKCDLLVSARGVTDKIGNGLLKTFVSHIKAAEVQAGSGSYTIRLEPGKHNSAGFEPSRPAGGGASLSWFTKGTVERVFKYVSSPEVLERAGEIDDELLGLEDSLQDDESLELYKVDKPASEILLTEPQSNSRSPPARPGSPSLRQPKGLSHNGGTRENGDGDGQLSQKRRTALERRIKELQREQVVVLARACAAGFDSNQMANLAAFANCFEAKRLWDSSKRFTALARRRETLLLGGPKLSRLTRQASFASSTGSLSDEADLSGGRSPQGAGDTFAAMNRPASPRGADIARVMSPRAGARSQKSEEGRYGSPGLHRTWFQAEQGPVSPYAESEMSSAFNDGASEGVGETLKYQSGVDVAAATEAAFSPKHVLSEEDQNGSSQLLRRRASLQQRNAAQVDALAKVGRDSPHLTPELLQLPKLEQGPKAGGLKDFLGTLQNRWEKPKGWGLARSASQVLAGETHPSSLSSRTRSGDPDADGVFPDSPLPRRTVKLASGLGPESPRVKVIRLPPPRSLSPAAKDRLSSDERRPPPSQEYLDYEARRAGKLSRRVSDPGIALKRQDSFEEAQWDSARDEVMPVEPSYPSSNSGDSTENQGGGKDRNGELLSPTDTPTESLSPRLEFLEKSSVEAHGSPVADQYALDLSQSPSPESSMLREKYLTTEAARELVAQSLSQWLPTKDEVRDTAPLPAASAVPTNHVTLGQPVGGLPPWTHTAMPAVGGWAGAAQWQQQQMLPQWQTPAMPPWQQGQPPGPGPWPPYSSWYPPQAPGSMPPSAAPVWHPESNSWQPAPPLPPPPPASQLPPSVQTDANSATSEPVADKQRRLTPLEMALATLPPSRRGVIRDRDIETEPKMESEEEPKLEQEPKPKAEPEPQPEPEPTAPLSPEQLEEARKFSEAMVKLEQAVLGFSSKPVAASKPDQGGGGFLLPPEVEALAAVVAKEVPLDEVMVDAAAEGNLWLSSHRQGSAGRPRDASLFMGEVDSCQPTAVVATDTTLLTPEASGAGLTIDMDDGMWAAPRRSSSPCGAKSSQGGGGFVLEEMTAVQDTWSPVPVVAQPPVPDADMTGIFSDAPRRVSAGKVANAVVSFNLEEMQGGLSPLKTEPPTHAGDSDYLHGVSVGDAASRPNVHESSFILADAELNIDKERREVTKPQLVAEEEHFFKSSHSGRVGKADRGAVHAMELSQNGQILDKEQEGAAEHQQTLEEEEHYLQASQIRRTGRHDVDAVHAVELSKSAEIQDEEQEAAAGVVDELELQELSEVASDTSAWSNVVVDPIVASAQRRAEERLKARRQAEAKKQEEEAKKKEAARSQRLQRISSKLEAAGAAVPTRAAPAAARSAARSTAAPASTARSTGRAQTSTKDLGTNRSAAPAASTDSMARSGAVALASPSSVLGNRPLLARTTSVPASSQAMPRAGRSTERVQAAPARSRSPAVGRQSSLPAAPPSPTMPASPRATSSRTTGPAAARGPSPTRTAAAPAAKPRGASPSAARPVPASSSPSSTRLAPPSPGRAAVVRASSSTARPGQPSPARERTFLQKGGGIGGSGGGLQRGAPSGSTVSSASSSRGTEAAKALEKGWNGLSSPRSAASKATSAVQKRSPPAASDKTSTAAPVKKPSQPSSAERQPGGRSYGATMSLMMSMPNDGKSAQAGRSRPAATTESSSLKKIMSLGMS